MRMLDETSVRSFAGDRIPASQLLRQTEVHLSELIAEGRLPRFELGATTTPVDIASVETAIKYAVYLRRQECDFERARKEERRRIPPGFPFERVPGLSREIVQRLSQVRPDTLGHALRIPGVTPAAVAVLSAYVGRQAV
jgi:tRNA uridine 5-carboxymethylaminomethyl modification enzyme